MIDLFDTASEFGEVIRDIGEIVRDIDEQLPQTEKLRKKVREKMRKKHGFNEKPTDRNLPVYFIVTNVTGIGEYTPSVFNTIDEATDWMKECCVRNFINAFRVSKHPIVFDGRTVGKGNIDEFQYLKRNNLVDKFIDEIINHWEYGDGDCYVHDYTAEICYSDGSFNHMQVYEVYYEVDTKNNMQIKIRAPKSSTEICFF